MGNVFCCASRKGKDDDSDDDLGAELRQGMQREEVRPEREMIQPGDFEVTGDMQEYLNLHLDESASHEDANGFVDFDYFKKFFRVAHVWNRIYFQKQDKKFIKERRQALKSNDSTLYAEIIQNAKDFDEVLMQDVIGALLTHTKMGSDVFQSSFAFYSNNAEKLEDLQAVGEETKEDKGEHIIDDEEREFFMKRDAPLSKKEILAVQKQLQDLSIEAIESLKTLPPAMIQMEAVFLPYKLVDNLFLRTGVEQADLDFSTLRLEMDKDAEYIAMMKEYNQKMENLQK